MYAEGGTVDSITLINALQNQGQLDEAGGKAAVNTLASTVPCRGQRAPVRGDRA